MVRTEVRVAEVLQSIWLPTSAQAAAGQVKALRELRPGADVRAVSSSVPKPSPKVVDVKA